MKKLALWKSACDFAYAYITESNAITLQEAATKTFKGAGFGPLDLDLWNSIARQQRQQFDSIARQKLPSENAEAAKPKTEAPAAVQASA